MTCRRPGLGLFYAHQSPAIPFAGFVTSHDPAIDEPLLPRGLGAAPRLDGCVTAQSLTVETIVKAIRAGIIPREDVERLGSGGIQDSVAVLENMADRINLELRGHVGR